MADSEDSPNDDRPDDGQLTEPDGDQNDVDVEVEDQDADEQPSIDDDEMADFSSVAESIEESTGPDARRDDQDDDRDDVDDQEDGEDLSLDAGDDSGRSVSVGTVYCNGLGMSAAVARTSWGSADEDERDELMEEYAGVAEQLEIDECVDEWLEEHGGIDELSPGQATIVLTAMWAGMVAMDDPDMISNAAEEVGAS